MLFEMRCPYLCFGIEQNMIEAERGECLDQFLKDGQGNL